MGLFGFFKNSAPSEDAIRKQVTYVKEQYAKPEYRRAAMDKLLGWGTREALLGLLNRFTVVVQSPHWDEEEKRWLVEEFVARGEMAKDVLTEFISYANEVTYAIRALSRLTSSEEELVAILLQALKARAPEDHRSGQSKMELIAALEERNVPGLASAVVPYLDDHNDDVTCMTLDLIALKKEASAYPRIVQMLSEKHHSARVLRHAAATAFKLDIGVDSTQILAPEITEDYIVKDGKLRLAHAG